ncbi:MAG: type II toxin-antitoxin system HicB family antitoxin [Lachnospiraceae bacterium]|nr:type II toxin-antitoxin system HicB family antitoxin [Lachnospiraceae bacterium]
MLNYDVFITWSEEDKAYIASVPEFAGCIADGETREEAFHNLEIVAQEWIETAKEHGRDIPKPKKKNEYAFLA